MPAKPMTAENLRYHRCYSRWWKAGTLKCTSFTYLKVLWESNIAIAKKGTKRCLYFSLLKVKWPTRQCHLPQKLKYWAISTTVQPQLGVWSMMQSSVLKSPQCPTEPVSAHRTDLLWKCGSICSNWKEHYRSSKPWEQLDSRTMTCTCRYYAQTCSEISCMQEMLFKRAFLGATLIACFIYYLPDSRPWGSICSTADSSQ